MSPPRGPHGGVRIGTGGRLLEKGWAAVFRLALECLDRLSRGGDNHRPRGRETDPTSLKPAGAFFSLLQSLDLNFPHLQWLSFSSRPNRGEHDLWPTRPSVPTARSSAGGDQSSDRARLLSHRHSCWTEQRRMLPPVETRDVGVLLPSISVESYGGARVKLTGTDHRLPTMRWFARVFGWMIRRDEGTSWESSNARRNGKRCTHLRDC